MLSVFNNFLLWFDDFVWGVPLIVLILAVGICLTIRLRVLQVRQLPRALKYMVKNEEGGHGEVLLAKEAQILSCPATGLQQMTAVAQQGQEGGMGACHEGGARGGVVRRRGGVWQGCRAHRGGGRYSSRFAPGC